MKKNILAIIVSALINNIIGFFWYSPFAFGTMWANLAGIDMSGEFPVAPMIYGLLLTIAVAIGLTMIIDKLNLSMEGSIKMAFWGWLIFLVPYGLQACIYSGLAPMLFAINIGYNFFGYLSMAAAIGYIKQR